jgi:Heterokaryon incompatibility protein (HET)
VTPVDCPETPRVLTTLGIKGQYLTLSYCWGPRQDYVLTTDNLQSCIQGLDISKLSRTIRDAIEVTKSLGFKYLWVDALCIIQDSEKSKTSELSVMYRIYEDSSLTIVAASAASAYDGFLGVRKTSERKTFIIPCRLGQDRFSLISMQEHEQYDDSREPANERAWTLQEQLLSPRLLIYASHTLQWHCRTMTCNLGDSYHAPNLSSIPRLPFIDSGSKVALTSGDKARQRPIEDAQLTLQHWMRLIISYSYRDATLPSDKLTALAALALYFSPILGPHYFAGIWGELFLQQLCWHSPSDTIFFSSPSQYRAPSWSWASVDGPLYFRTYAPNNYLPYRCELVQCRTTLKSKSLSFGEVISGYLTLRAILREGRFHATRSKKITWQATSLEKENNDDSVSEQGSYWDFARGFSDTAQDNVDAPIVCLPMYTVEGMEVDKVGGLMLNALQGGLFRRTGRFVADRSDFDHILQRDVTIV